MINSTFMIISPSQNAKIVNLIQVRYLIFTIVLSLKKGKLTFSKQLIVTKIMSTTQDRRTKTGKRSISHIISKEGKIYIFSPIFIISCHSLMNKFSKNSKHSSGKSTSKSLRKRKRA